MAYQTLREQAYYKTGRQGVVLEAIDLMKPNLFDDNANIGNSIFHYGSKFRFTLVDSRKSDKGKALYYNFDPSEVLLLTYLLSDGVVSSFKKRAGAYNALPGAEQNYVKELVETFPTIDFTRFDRTMDYSKAKEANMVSFQKNISIGDNKLLVRKVTISYEEAMRSASKWKLIIEVGEAQKDDKSGNGLNIIKPGTYKATDSSMLMLQANELLTPINEASKRVILSQGVFYSQMKQAEFDFTKRKIEAGDYNGEKIDEWNPQGKAPERKAQNTDKKPNANTTASKPQETKKEEGLKCADCSATIDQRVNDFSKKNFGRPLCFKCQTKEKEKKGKTA